MQIIHIPHSLENNDKKTVCTYSEQTHSFLLLLIFDTGLVENTDIESPYSEPTLFSILQIVVENILSTVLTNLFCNNITLYSHILPFYGGGNPYPSRIPTGGKRFF